MGKRSFKYVYIPADTREPVEERELSYTEETVVPCLTDKLKEHFKKVQPTGAQMAQIKAEMMAGLGKDVPITDEMVSMASGLTLVETVCVLPNIPATGHEGVNFYVDDRGVMKGLPVNVRASEVAALCLGEAMQITGDAFVAKVMETEEDFERRDFTTSELSSSAEWVKAASKLSAEKKKRESPQVTLDRMTEAARAPKPVITEVTPAGEAKDRGNDHFKAGRYEQAAACYTEGIGHDASVAALYNNRAMALLKMDRFPEAEADCTKCLELDPKSVKALLRRGAARVAMERQGEAASDFGAALAIQPSNKEAQEWLAKLG